VRKQTCGPMYLEGLINHTQGDTELIRVYSAGFVNGQAEKVYLGACPAAMFRPSPGRYDLVLGIALEAAVLYQLSVEEYDDEIWICRSHEIACQVMDLRKLDRESAKWHIARAWLCGIPTNEVDPRFHIRKGYGERGG
jgi:hypothetical protein